MTVLDLGGTARFWEIAPVRPQRVTVVNVTHLGATTQPWVTRVTGDACDLPSSVGRSGYDLVFSNSVLEHVGGHYRRQAFAETVLTAAARYWVQTPYRYFPIEPHWLFPFFQFLAPSARARIAMSWPLVHSQPASHASALGSVLGTELVGIAELSHYFPEATILRERFLGLTKSLVALKS